MTLTKDNISVIIIPLIKKRRKKKKRNVLLVSETSMANLIPVWCLSLNVAYFWRLFCVKSFFMVFKHIWVSGHAKSRLLSFEWRPRFGFYFFVDICFCGIFSELTEKAKKFCKTSPYMKSPLSLGFFITIGLCRLLMVILLWLN